MTKRLVDGGSELRERLVDVEAGLRMNDEKGVRRETEVRVGGAKGSAV